MLHLYFGNGKGKTSAAIGLGVRACGRGRHVLMAQFLKSQESGEILYFNDCKLFNALQFKANTGFVINPTDEQREQLKEEINLAIKFVESELANYDVIILDEVLDAIDLELLDEEALISRLISGNDNIEFVFTGRRASDRLIELADYVTDMTLVKHPYQRGVKAREGIEY